MQFKHENISNCVYFNHEKYLFYMQADREARARRNGNYMIFDDDYID